MPRPNSGMAQHHAPMKNDEWLTPPSMIKSLGEFDLDPCSPVVRPWETAKKHYTINDNGLLQEWEGRVWLNPPYGKYTLEWMNKMALHNNGIALIFAKTDTGVWHDIVFRHASAILFLRGRIKFYTTSGEEAKFNGGAPSALIAFNEDNAIALATSGIIGKIIPLE
jgi:hypothetical protein